MMTAPASAGVLDISKIGVGARSLAMGRAQIAASDVGSSFVNPACAAEFENFAMTSMYTNLAEDTAFSVIGGVFPLKEGAFGAIGIGYIGAAVSGIYTTTSEVRSGSTGTTDYGSRLLIFSWGREVNSTLKAGGAVKFFSKSFESLSQKSADGTSLDLGFSFYPKDNITAGLSLQNIFSTKLTWASGTKEDIPANIKMGLNFKPRKEWTILLDYDSNRDIHAGAEVLIRNALFLRGGIENTNYTAGVGIKLGGMNFDYAYYIDTLLSSNSSHFISISYAVPDKTIELRPIMPAQIPQNPFL